MYFDNCSTVEEVKALFRKLARQYHPDLGGCEETMKAVNNSYEAALEGCNGQVSQGTDGKEHTYRYDAEVEKEIMDFIYAFLAKQLPLEASLIGVWVWITGDTKPHKDVLKELNCKWHTKRGCWYFRPEGHKSWGGGGSLEDLAAKYGETNLDKFKKKEPSTKRLKK